MGLLAQLLEVGEGELRAFRGQLYAQAVSYHRAALTIHQREVLEVSAGEGCGHLAGQREGEWQRDLKFLFLQEKEVSLWVWPYL